MSLSAQKLKPVFGLMLYLLTARSRLYRLALMMAKAKTLLYHLIQKNKNWKALFVEPVPYLFERLED